MAGSNLLPVTGAHIVRAHLAHRPTFGHPGAFRDMTILDGLNGAEIRSLAPILAGRDREIETVALAEV